MFRKLNPVLALAAGLAGGLLSRYLAPVAVHAQAPPPPPAATAPVEIQAESFTLVDSKGAVVGRFTTRLLNGRLGQPGVVLLDGKGNELWRAGLTIRPATQ